MSSPEQTVDPVAMLARRAWRAFNRRFDRRTQVTILALALILGQLLFRWWATAGSWFMWDDYIFLADVARGEDTGWGWIFRSHFSLVMPLSFGLVKLVGSAGLAWHVIATQILALQLLASLACWWMLRTVFGDRRRILIPLVFYLANPMTMPAAVWWSVSINQLPHHIAIFGAVAAHVLYCRTRRVRWAVLATAFLLFGFGSYVKSPLIVVVLVAISACWFTSGGWRERLRTFAYSWPAWLLYASTTLGYFVLWRSRQLGSTPSQACELTGVLNTSIVNSIVPGLAGGPWNWRLWQGGVDPFIAASKCVPQSYRGDPTLLVGGAPQSLAAAPLIGLITAWLVVLGLMFYRWSRYHNAMQGLWFMVPYIGLSAVFVYLGRAATFGSQVSAREIRYFSDVAAVAALALGTALMPVVGANRRLERRPEPYLRVDLPRWPFKAVAAFYLIGALISSISYAAPWHDSSDPNSFPERVFVQNVRTQLAAKDRQDLPVQVADVPLPVTVANPVIYPYNLPSYKLSPLAPDLQAVLSGTDLSILDSKGNIQEAWIPDAPRAEPGPVDGCGYQIQQTAVSIPIAPVVDVPWWVRIDYLASQEGVLTVNAGRTTTEVPVTQGLHSMFFATEGSFESVTLRAKNAITVCADNVHVGYIEPKVKDTTP